MVGSSPYGYRKIMVKDGAKKRAKLEPDKVAAPVVKRIFDMAEAGNATLDIARTLNNEGISSAKGSRPKLCVHLSHVRS